MTESKSSPNEGIRIDLTENQAAYTRMVLERASADLLALGFMPEASTRRTLDAVVKKLANANFNGVDSGTKK